jgi:hypothetical protein
MSDRPWDTEPDSLDFEAEGLPCAARRGPFGVWCGYVSVGPEHPLFGLPLNHLLKLPPSWFEGRTLDQGIGPMDIFIHALSGAESIDDACPISLAFHVHGGVTYADDEVSGCEPGRWWFGFDCGHAGDYMPSMPDMNEIMRAVVDSMPERVRGTMHDIMAKNNTNVYRDQQYVVGECQSLAAQLIAIVNVIKKETADGRSHDRSD